MAVNEVRFNATGDWLAVASDNRQVRCFHFDTKMQQGPPDFPFDVHQALAEMKTLRDEGDWFDLRQALTVLEMYRLSRSQREELDHYHLALSTAAQTRLEEIIEERKTGDIDEVDFRLALPDVVDLDPTKDRIAKVLQCLP